ncbi:MAG TPA: MarR family transcriptional regulator [Chloroflexi bacterium]|nr:MAG: MarR family transcriptional regulator [Chloroflexota bacterium]HDD55538.1 MarR family transcriptional regulator [Chloroflexota bacterium]
MDRNDPFINIFREWIELFMHRSMHGYIHHARKKGLRMSVIGTLHHLRRAGHVGVSDLGEHLGVSSAAASQMLDRLVEEGLITRVEDPEDRRMKRIALTERGSEILEESVNARLGWLEEMRDRFSEEEKEQLAAAMRLMVDKAREARSSSPD